MPCRGGKDFFSAPGRRFCRLLTVRGSLRNIFLFSAEYFKQGFLLCRRASLQGLRHGKFRVLLRQPVFFSRFCQERKAHMARAQTQTIARTMYEWRLEGMEEGNCPAL
ncbi:hypothetical protein CUB89_03270 [Akkermansia muciniphila]|jgi:hypothetical protein|nr:hypothetical protein CUB89_03270 [Akkermansia muciniphila]